jgi:hypothetical protein
MKILIKLFLPKKMTDLEAALLGRFNSEPAKWFFNLLADGTLVSINRELSITVKSKPGSLGRFRANAGAVEFGPYAAFAWHEAAARVFDEREKLRKSKESDEESAQLKRRLGLK